MYGVTEKIEAKIKAEWREMYDMIVMENGDQHVPKIAAIVAIGTNLKKGIRTLARTYKTTALNKAETRLVAPVWCSE